MNAYEVPERKSHICGTTIAHSYGLTRKWLTKRNSEGETIVKILLVGNDPHEIGGVANYTRPLARKFVEQGNDVFYFFSGAWNRDYNWRLKPYLKINRVDFPFECAGLVNSPCWPTNFGNPDIDISESRTDKLFSAYLDHTKPDVIHMHSRVGLPASIMKCAAMRGIPIINTIHVYGFLCQKRVMIDHHGNSCEGPSNLMKCALCTGKINIRKGKFNARLANTSKTLLNFIVHAKRLLKGAPANQPLGNAHTPACISADPALVEGIARRLHYMTHLMNLVIDRTICVSEDVKKTLMRFGVDEKRLLVQHIGSLIAETQRPRKNQLHDPIVIGNIGGVSHYKGIHVLIGAVERMKSLNFRVNIFGKYDDEFKTAMMKGREHLPIEFMGRYIPEQLSEILEQIDVMVLPSICNDTAPQTIFESYSRFVPIVASDIGGFPDFIKDGINGHLFKPGDAAHLANILDDIVTDPIRLSIFSKQIPKMKTIQQNADELLFLYKTLRSSRCFM